MGVLCQGGGGQGSGVRGQGVCGQGAEPWTHTHPRTTSPLTLLCALRMNPGPAPTYHQPPDAVVCLAYEPWTRTHPRTTSPLTLLCALRMSHELSSISSMGRGRGVLCLSRGAKKHSGANQVVSGTGW